MLHIHETAYPDRFGFQWESFSMIRNLLLAAAFTGLTAATAFASGPVLLDEANSPTVVYDAPSRNIVGSANSTVSGSPGQTQYETQRVLRTQAPSSHYDFGVNQPWQIEVNSSN